MLECRCSGPSLAGLSVKRFSWPGEEFSTHFVVETFLHECRWCCNPRHNQFFVLLYVLGLSFYSCVMKKFCCLELHDGVAALQKDRPQPWWATTGSTRRQQQSAAFLLEDVSFFFASEPSFETHLDLIITCAVLLREYNFGN